MENSEKKYIVFAGVNGVGKSTLYYLHPELQNEFRINMDEIAAQLGDWQDLSVTISAGKQAIKLRQKYFKEGVSFNQETTLCGHDPIRAIQKAKSFGYFVEMHYVGVDSVEICKERIRKRVSDGGHGVSDTLVERRYSNSFINLKKVIPFCDKILFYDNTNEFILFCLYVKNEFKYLTDEVPRWFIENIFN